MPIIINFNNLIETNASKIYKLSILQVPFLSLKFIAIDFSDSCRTVSMISSHVIIDSSVVLSKYLPFSQIHVLGFQI